VVKVHRVKIKEESDRRRAWLRLARFPDNRMAGLGAVGQILSNCLP
jgi:hypothetical protein